MHQENEKRMAAREAVKLVKEGMIVGLGSGSTSGYMIRKLGEEVAKGLKVKGVPSSRAAEKLALEAGIPLISLADAMKIDMNIDGADEFDPSLQLIKGGGGALLREKVLAHNSRFNVIIADSSKQVEHLGSYKLPVETIPFATRNILAELKEAGLKPLLREEDGSPYTTDENNNIIDLDILGYPDLHELQDRLIRIPGLVETGLFLNTTDLLIMGQGESAVIFKRNQ
jgi:ribose 5-phosphate isomerase A